jgi:nucleotide-binding universal stress UspA family protein
MRTDAGTTAAIMTELEDLFSVRRILVALDPSTPGTALLDAAVEFANRIEAELEGLFVEDIDLMRLAELPFAHELSLPTGLPQPLDLASMEREMRMLAAGARRMLETRAREMHVRCSFRVVRGRIEAEVRAAADTADLVILDRAGATVTRHVRLKSIAGQAAKGAPHSVLLLRGVQAAIGSAVVVCDGTAASDRALAAAARLGSRLRRAGETGITVLCLGDTRAAAQRAEQKARDALQREGIVATFRTLIGASPAGLAAALRLPADVLLVLSAELPLIAFEEGERFLADSEGPVLLVR